MSPASITTKAVNTWLRAVRAPLTSAEVVLRKKTDDHSWTPAVLFEGFEALVRERAGSLLNNEELNDQARLQRAELAQRRLAAEKRMEAEQRAMAAEAEYARKREAVAAEEVRVERQTQQEKARLERERREAKQQVDAKAAQQQAALADVTEKRERSVAKQARKADVQKLSAEERALAEKEKALKAKARALELDDKVRQTKARRKSGS